MSLFSHEFHEDSSDEFGTPAEFHRPLADAVDGFDLDPASGAESQPLASTRYTKEDDGLSQEWFGTVWLNPPFSEKTRWVRKARAEVADGNVETAVVLLPVDTSTKLFHNHVTDATAICFVEGRLSFDGGDRNPNFGTLLAVFGDASNDLLDVLDRKGSVYRVDAKHERAEQQELVTDGGTDQSADGVDRGSVSMAAFDDLLTFEGEHATPTTHAPIIRDDNELLIYAKRTKNADSEWEVRSYRIVGERLRVTTSDADRAGLAAVLLETFEEASLAADGEYKKRAPLRAGIPVSVAVDGKPAVAAWLYVSGESREMIADRMAVSGRTVSEYLSRFRRRGVGLPDDVEPPTVGQVMETVPSRFDPGEPRQQIVVDGGEARDE